MFSRAERFNYYPKAEEPVPSSCCQRCNRKHGNCTPENCHSTIRSSKRRFNNQSSSIKKKVKISSNRTQNQDADDPTPSCSYSVTPVVKTEEAFSKIEVIGEKIDERHLKMKKMRKEIRSTSTAQSSDEGFNSSRSSSPQYELVFEEQILHRLEKLNRLGTKEFKDISKKRQEELRQADHKTLVDFCSELVLELSSRLAEEKKKTKRWRKLKSFFKMLARPFSRNSSSEEAS